MRYQTAINNKVNAIPILSALTPLSILSAPNVASMLRCITMVTGAFKEPARNKSDSSCAACGLDILVILNWEPKCWEILATLIILLFLTISLLLSRWNSENSVTIGLPIFSFEKADIFLPPTLSKVKLTSGIPISSCPARAFLMLLPENTALLFKLSLRPLLSAICNMPAVCEPSASW